MSPGTAAWSGTAAVVSRAIKLILDGGLDGDNVEALAGRVGIGARHLRRLFSQHLGASPVTIARTHRAYIARAFIEDTSLPITDIAFRSGFKSIRQFNQVVRATFDSSPSELRSSRTRTESSRQQGGLTVCLPYRPPLDWPALIKFLKARAIPGVEQVEADLYRRTIMVDGEAGEIEVRPDSHRPRLLLRVKLKKFVNLVRVIDRVRRLFDLSADPVQISRHLSNDPRLKPLVEARPGLRVPGAWDGFDLCVKALLGESLTAAASTEVLAKLVRTFGEPVKSDGSLTHLFPSPRILAEADLARVGLSAQHAAVIRKLAAAVSRRLIAFESAYSPSEVPRRLFEIPGMDDAKAAYITMRAYGEPDAFPLTDRDRYGALDIFDKELPAEKLSILVESWRPWRAYAAMYLTA